MNGGEETCPSTKLRGNVCLAAETNLGGSLQLLVDLKFLAGAFSPLVNSQHEASIASCKDLILEQAMAVATGKSEKPDPLAQCLNAWLDSAQVTCITSLPPLAPCFDTLARP